MLKGGHAINHDSVISFFHNLVFRGQTIPRIKYTPEEIETWGKVFNELKRIHDRYASAEYKQNFRELEKEAGYRSFIFRVHFF